MKRPLSFIRRHPRLSAGIAAIFLVAVVTFVVRAAGPAQGPVHSSAAADIALASATTGSASTSHSAYTALTRRERRAVATTTTGGRSGGHGIATQPTTSAALSQSLQQATGLTPSQVTSRSVCPSLGRGQARCAAESLVLRSNGTPVRPRVRPEATLGRVHPVRRSAIAKRATHGSATAAPTTGQPTSVTPPTPDTPAYLQQAYDLSYLSQTGGTGDTVGIVDAYDDPTAQSDLDTYRSNYGLPACDSGCFTKVNESGNASPLPAASSDWETEISLDLDTVSAICPNCHILLVEASTSNQSDLETAMQTAARLHATQISDSWTLPESGHVANFIPSGVATVAATGDQGYVGTLRPGFDNYPAAFPGVTAAGGTSLAPAATSTARGFSESAWSVTQTPPEGGGSGCDVNESRPTYQPNMGCNGRAYADLSADADPNTGLEVVENGNWGVVGGTSLATPLIAAYYAITGIDETANTTSAKWAYTTPDSALLNDITSGSNGTCSAYPYICTAGTGYDGPTGMGSISGDVIAGAPGIGGPPIRPQFTPTTSGASDPNSYTESTRADGATITGGIYPNGLDTTWWIQYWPANGGGPVGQTPASDIGSGTAPVVVTGYPTHLSPSTTYDYELVAQNADGTTDGYTYSFTTGSQSTTAPLAAFTSSPTAAKPASAVSFNASGSTDSNATIIDYSWNFGDGSPIVDAGETLTASHTYTNPGTYNVTLIVTNSIPESETITQTVTVDSTPTASFSLPTQPTPGTATAFDASASIDSVGTITDYSWNFGDGSPVVDAGSTASTTHSYATRGHYTVTLTVTNDAGQTATFHQAITVDDPPSVTISPTVAVTTPGSTVSFNGTATAPDSGGSISGLSWNFGDPSSGNNTSTATNPSHTFANAGAYTVTLTATDEKGMRNDETATVKVDARPTAAFSASATTASPASPGTAVSFNASASSDTVGTIIDYKWNFGDGSPADDTGATPTVSYTYATRQNYTATLTVTNDDGQTATTTQTVTVDDPPTASVTPSATVSTPSSPVSFTSTAASPDAGGSIGNHSWNFGDGTTLSGASDTNASHTYTSPGVYTVTLTVTDDLGVSSSASTTITIDAVPTVTFTASANPATAGSTVAFNAGGSSDSYGTITSYSWNFGDGTTATGVAPSHAYASPGTYTVSLNVTNDAGQSATQTGTITVNSSASPTPPVTSTTTSTTTTTTTPTPVPNASPLTASLTGAKKQKLSPALAHGVKVSLAVNQSSKATFQVTLPVLQSKLAHGRRSKNASIALLQTGTQTLGAGTHAMTLKLSRAAARELASSGPLVLTVKVTLTGASGSTLTRSLKITLAR